MSISAQRRIQQGQINLCEVSDNALAPKVMHSNAYELRKICASGCLRKGNTISREQATCLTSCYNKRSHAYSLKTFI